jgi:hypothetical protein
MCMKVSPSCLKTPVNPWVRGSSTTEKVKFRWKYNYQRESCISTDREILLIIIDVKQRVEETAIYIDEERRTVITLHFTKYDPNKNCIFVEDVSSSSSILWSKLLAFCTLRSIHIEQPRDPAASSDSFVLLCWCIIPYSLMSIFIRFLIHHYEPSDRRKHISAACILIRYSSVKGWHSVPHKRLDVTELTLLNFNKTCFGNFCSWTSCNTKFLHFDTINTIEEISRP